MPKPIPQIVYGYDGPCDALMVNPPWLSKDQNIWNGVRSAMPPLGLLSVASYAESKGYKVRVVDIHIEGYSAEQFLEKVRTAKPRVVGISVMTATANAANQVARLVKSVVPDCTVVFGGVHAEALPSEALRNSSVDCVVRGDGEESFIALLEGKAVKDIPGLSWRDGTKLVHNKPATVEMNLDRFPFPAYHLVPMHKYYPAIGAYARLPAINMLMTRGCPGKCTFCNSAMTTLRSRSPESMVEEIKYLRETYGIREIQFYDDTFTVAKKSVLRFCELMIEADLGVAWVAFVRADCFSETLAVAMKKAGCHQVLVGVESGSDQILETIRKPIEREKTLEVVRIARKVGIESRASFILGSPGETTETIRQTMEFSKELDADIVQYNICTPYPGTQMYRWAQENHCLVSEEWSDFELSEFMMKLPTIETAEIHKAYAEGHRDYYLRPKLLVRTALRVTSLAHVKDLVHAFFYIALRRRLRPRVDVRRDWIGHRKEAYFDLPAFETARPMLTYEVRLKGMDEPDAAAAISA